MMTMRVLLFEDEPLLRELLTHFLRGRGCEVVAYAEPLHCPVYDGLETCSCSPGQVCGDAVLTDVEMPRVSGIEMVARQQDGGCGVPPCNVGIMSAGWTAERRKLARELGCRTFDKPFKLAEIEQWLEECKERVVEQRVLRDLR